MIKRSGAGTKDFDDAPATLTAMAGAVDDRVLLRRHLDGDPDAFAEIFRLHRDHLWAVALRTLGDADEAADALQDALLSAMRHAASFRGDALLSTWLHRIVVNACLDRLRRKAARPTVSLPDDDHAPAASRDAYDESDQAFDVRAALDTLSPEQRAAIVLVDIEGYPVDEVAKILEVPSGTVKSRCARGRAKLVPLLAHLAIGNQRLQANVEAGEPAPLSQETPSSLEAPPREELR